MYYSDNENVEIKIMFFYVFVWRDRKNVLPLQPLSRKHVYGVYLEAAGYSSARLECLLWEQEVVSSNLAIPTKERYNLQNQ